MTRSLTRAGRIGLICTLAAAVVACGDDDTASPDTTSAATAAQAPAATSAATPAQEAAGGSAQDVCEPYISVSLAFNGEPDPAALSADLDAVEAAAPEEIGDALNTMVTAARQVIASNGQDFSAFETAEFAAAMGTVDPWMYANCEFDHELEVTATEYEFVGLGDSMPAGRAGILLTNEGGQAHELAIMRKADGVTESWDEILALEEEEAEAMVEQAGSAFAAETGERSLAILDLTPGDYLAICFIPTGTLVEDGEFTEGTGEPHFVHGMKAEFTVT